MTLEHLPSLAGGNEIQKYGSCQNFSSIGQLEPEIWHFYQFLSDLYLFKRFAPPRRPNSGNLTRKFRKSGIFPENRKKFRNSGIFSGKPEKFRISGFADENGLRKE